ncbi:MAG: alanine dehydrogenase, partial [Flavobacteriaceae bacterium]
HTFVEKIIPAFFDNDSVGVLKRAKMTDNGQLTAAFSYLQNYVNGKE